MVYSYKKEKKNNGYKKFNKRVTTMVDRDFCDSEVGVEGE